MQDLMANGNYAPYLAQALTPPILGTAGMSGYGMQGIAPQLANPGINPAFSSIGQAPFGNSAGLYPPGGVMGQQGFGQQLGLPQQLSGQQQQIASTLHHLAHFVAAHVAVGQQVGAALQQIAQYCIQQVATGQQLAQVLNQLAHQSAWQAQRPGGLGFQSVHGMPFGYSPTNVTPYGQPGIQPWSPGRSLW